MEKLEDFESFLKNVDKISQLVGDLRSSDAEVQQNAMEKADRYIASLAEPCRTKIDKTTINTNPPPLQPSTTPQSETPENFMKIMEVDAEERRVRKAAKVKKATAFKDKGNEAYAQEDYETAVKYYSDGLAEIRDMQPLYTNRAQAYIKLRKYKEAISDCEWALKCNERCIKAYLHMGKAYLGLKKYKEARNCFEKVQEIQPGTEKMVKEYLTQVDLEKEKETQEIKASGEFDKGERKATIVVELLEKLSNPSQIALYYCGGLEILSQALTDFTGQTLFRLNNGFSIIRSNDTVRSPLLAVYFFKLEHSVQEVENAKKLQSELDENAHCLLDQTDDPESRELCVSVLKLWRIVCCGNDENQKLLMTCPVATHSIVHLASSEHDEVEKECLALLSVFSEMPRGRHLAIESLDLHMLVRNLMVCISKPKKQQENTAVNILEYFATESRFCIQLRNVWTDSFTLPLTTILRTVNKSNQHVVLSLISTLGYLARDDVIRHKLAHEPECLKASVVAIRMCSASEYREILYPLLGFIINLSTVTSPVTQEHSVSLCDCCMDLLRHSDGGIITRATGVLSTVLPQSSQAIQHVTQRKVVKTMCRLLKGTGQTATKYAIKTLTVCTAASHLAREELVNSDKKLSILRHLLSSSSDEMVSGNAALCLAHCLELEGVASNLLGTDIVLLLLRHAAGDAKRTAVQQNAAIALGKLCRAEPRHTSKLRELHGLEILHSCVKLIS